MSAGNKFGSSRTKAQQIAVGAGEGALVISDTAAHDGNFEAVEAVAAAVARFYAPDTDGDLSAVPLPVGIRIPIVFTRIILASGKVLAYYGSAQHDVSVAPPPPTGDAFSSAFSSAFG